MNRLLRIALAFVAVSAAIGGVLIVLDSVWMTYGMFVRYVLRSPDPAVTEATGLLLVPLAFAGLPLALKDNSFPRVTFLLERLPQRWQRIVETAHYSLLFILGSFLLLVTAKATYQNYLSGASSYVLEWPEFPFWIPVTFAVFGFTFLACLMLFVPACRPKAHHLDST